MLHGRIQDAVDEETETDEILKVKNCCHITFYFIISGPSISFFYTKKIRVIEGET